ncbi:MAG TPA: MBL fold metallo-hydrolase [Terriglobales bacterium]|nr:MBL fold metallo-hydrolase [Terriglobales bacterium]
MRRISLLLCALLMTAAAFAGPKKSLDIYSIDVEGGQATLIVSPSGQSMLVDTGFPGFAGRDADRIAAVVKTLGLKQIDYVLITHYHRDHVGGVPQLADRVKIGTFIDHGPAKLDDPDVASADYNSYMGVLPKAQHLVVKPGDKIPLKGVDIKVLAAAGDHISDPLPGAGQPNPFCASEPAAVPDLGENARSVGMLFTYGKFRFIDLGDLTKKKEIELACPNNLIGTVDLYLVTHHGLDLSNAKALVHTLHPKVAIMNNGPHKGGKPAAWQIVHDSPGLEDLWQLHTAVDAGKDHNVPDQFIANLDEKNDAGNYIKVTARPDGSFTIFNSRNNFEKTYKK